MLAASPGRTQLTLRGSSGHSALQAPGIQTHATPALPSPVSLPLQGWAVMINYVTPQAARQAENCPWEQRNGEPGEVKVLGRGKEWKDNSAANAWAGWDASDGLSLFLQMLLILVFRSWVHFWKHFPLHWTSKRVRCGACVLNHPEQG